MLYCLELFGNMLNCLELFGNMLYCLELFCNMLYCLELFSNMLYGVHMDADVDDDTIAAMAEYNMSVWEGFVDALKRDRCKLRFFLFEIFLLFFIVT